MDVTEAFKQLFREVMAEQSETRANSQSRGDYMLTAKETCTLLKMSKDWLYRNAENLPFTRRIAPGSLRFSYEGIQKWLKTR